MLVRVTELPAASVTAMVSRIAAFGLRRTSAAASALSGMVTHALERRHAS